MLKRIPLDQITRNPDQPRQNFDQNALEELAESIRLNGLQQPIRVRPTPDAEVPYMIVMGERRYRAYLILQERGLEETILAHVKNADDETMHLNAIIENLQRVDTSPVEDAVSYQRLIDQYGYTPETLASKLGIKQVFRINERLALLGLTEDNRELVTKGVVSITQGFYMARLSVNGQQKFLGMLRQGFCKGTAGAKAAAEQIEAMENQSAFDMGPEVVAKSRAAGSDIIAKLDKIADAVDPLFKNGEFKAPKTIRLSDAETAIEKVKLLRAHLSYIERGLMSAASAAAASG